MQINYWVNKPLRLGIFLLILASCQSDQKLPILGEKTINGNDTTYYAISNFEYLNQDSLSISQETFEDGFYIADFFFTSCPSICPKVKQQMLRIDEAFADENRLHFLSHSIDYIKDSIPELKKYADKLGVDQDRWHFIQLDRNFQPVANEYWNVAYEDESAPGGFDHSGRLILVDNEGHIRAFCNGTDPEDVDDFIDDISSLVREYDLQ